MRIERVVLVVAAGLVLLATAACHHAKPRMQDSLELDAWFVTTGREAGVRQAIIVEHTLYDYHFVPDSARLNDLGQHDLGVLSEHFAKYPGELNVRQGSVSDALYRRRVETVRTELVQAGVDAQRITLGAGLPGGPGLSGKRILFIMEKRADQPLEAPTAYGTGYGAGVPAMGEQSTATEARQ
jgi:hypothetical protein